MALSDASHALIPGDDLFAIHRGDCIKHMQEMPAHSVDFLICSVPFPALYAYTSEEGDIGNSEDLSHEMSLHFSFFYRGVLRVMKPGRAAVIHVMQIPRMARSGGTGLSDFRGLNIRLAERAGLTFEYDWIVRANPQAQAIRTRSRSLQFAGLESDRAKSRGALGGYLLKFQSPGENSVPVDSEGEVSRDNWISWAECCWSDIKEMDTLNFKLGKDENDTKHICPLQLAVYERCIRLYTNPGEVVFDPFAGVGSGGFVALGGRSPVTGSKLINQRRFYGCELKPSYHRTAIKFCEQAIEQYQRDQLDLFSFAEPIIEEVYE